MRSISLFEAKTHLSGVVASLLDGSEAEVRILRHGKPVASLTPIRGVDTARRLGVAKGQFRVPDDIDGANPAVARLFGVECDDAHSS
jgi:antitoxin (DNA-binding transcriptional repressor) of toxin-antitoxin stability system